MDEAVEALERLLIETAKAHHQAFIGTDGADPDWPLWYADSLREPLQELLEAELTKSDLVYLLVKMHFDQQASAPGAAWARFYAKYLADAYL